MHLYFNQIFFFAVHLTKQSARILFYSLFFYEKVPVQISFRKCLAQMFFFHFMIYHLINFYQRFEKHLQTRVRRECLHDVVAIKTKFNVIQRHTDRRRKKLRFMAFIEKTSTWTPIFFFCNQSSTVSRTLRQNFRKKSTIKFFSALPKRRKNMFNFFISDIAI